jgi:hypothetical protein
MPLWKITDKGPSKVKETKFKQENPSIESAFEKAEKHPAWLKAFSIAAVGSFRPQSPAVNS